MMKVALNEAFVQSVASGLNAASVPCVLWGHSLMLVHGIPTILGTIDFVVPDALLSKAAEALTTIQHLVPCPDAEGCIDDANYQDRHTPPPSSHMHIEDSDVPVTLYRQSEILWFLPPIDETLVPPHLSTLSSPYQLATDKTSLPPPEPGRGSGFYKSNQTPIVIIKSHVLLEALLRMYARDCLKSVGSAAIPKIGYISQYVDEDGFLDTSKLPPVLETMYRTLREDETATFQWTKELRRALRIPL